MIRELWPVQIFLECEKQFARPGIGAIGVRLENEAGYFLAVLTVDKSEWQDLSDDERRVMIRGKIDAVEG